MRSIFALFLVFALIFSVSAQDCLQARVLGATWGLNDVTSAVAHKYNSGENTILANTDVLGIADEIDGTKTLTVVYEICQNVATLVALEGETVTIPSPYA